MENNMNIPDNTSEYVQQDGGTYYNGAKKKNMKWLWITIAALVVVAIVVGVLFLTGVLGAKGNAGVLALAQYYHGKQEKIDGLISNDQKAMQEKLLTEAFEVQLDMDIQTDALSSMVPLDSIPVKLEMKYDMKDLGLKTGVSGFEMFGAYAQIYLIEDEIIIASPGGTERITIDTPTDVDLDEPMTIVDRAKALLPFLPQDGQTVKDIIMQLALAVPNEYTETGRDQVYSPMEDDEVDVDVITTTLDKEALGVVIGQLDQNLENEDELMDTLQDMIDAFTDMFDQEDFDLDDELSDLADSPDDIPDIDISWSVYSRNSQFIGVSLYFEDEDMSEHTYTEMYEVGGKTAYMYTNVTGEDTDQTTLMNVIYDGNMFELDGEMTMDISDTLSGEASMMTNISGEGELLKNAGDRYEITAEIRMAMEDVSGIDNMLDGDMAFDVKLEGKCRFGDDLGLLGDNDDWNAIYDDDWKEGDSLFQGMDMFPDIM